VLAQDSGKNILLRDIETGKPCIFNLHSGLKPKALNNPKINKMLNIPAFLKHPLDPVQEQFFSIAIETPFKIDK
jgi:hypothetical protein